MERKKREIVKGEEVNLNGRGKVWKWAEDDDFFFFFFLAVTFWNHWNLFGCTKMEIPTGKKIGKWTFSNLAHLWPGYAPGYTFKCKPLGKTNFTTFCNFWTVGVQPTTQQKKLPKIVLFKKFKVYVWSHNIITTLSNPLLILVMIAKQCGIYICIWQNFV